MKNNMLNKIKSDYEKLEINPSDDLWSRLDGKLEQSSEKALLKPLLWWKYAAVMLLFVSVGAGLYFNTQKSSFNYRETDYIVKKGLEKTVNPINPEFQKQGSYQELEVIPVKTNEIQIASRYQKKNTDSALHIKKTEKVLKPETAAVKSQELAVQQPEKVNIIPARIENHTPVIVQNKSAQPIYINSNELLLGREFDKTRESSQKNDIKFGIFNFEKPKPQVENVTVLGVTVYIDPK